MEQGRAGERGGKKVKIDFFSDGKKEATVIDNSCAKIEVLTDGGFSCQERQGRGRLWSFKKRQGRKRISACSPAGRERVKK